MNNLPVYMLYIWTVVDIGRPQDIFPIIKVINPGDVIAALTVSSYLFFGDKEQPILSFREFRVFLIFFAFATVCTPFGVYPRVSVGLLINFFLKFGLYLYLLAKLIKTEKHIDGMIKTIIISGLMMAVSAVYRSEIGIRIGGGSTYDPNDLAMMLVLTIPIALFQGMTTTSKTWKYVCYSGGALCLIGLTATMSRGGFLALMIVVMAIVFEKSLGFNKKRIVGMMIVLGLIFIVFAGVEYKERISTTFEDVSSLDAGSGRMMVWMRSLVIAIENPVLGVGPGAAFSAYGNYLLTDRFEGELSGSYSAKWKVTHNAYLQVLVEMGFPGLLLFITMIVYSLKNLNRIIDLTLQDDEFRRFRLRAISLRAAQIGFLVSILFLSQAYHGILYIFCVLSGVMVRNTENLISVANQDEPVRQLV